MKAESDSLVNTAYLYIFAKYGDRKSFKNLASLRESFMMPVCHFILFIKHICLICANLNLKIDINEYIYNDF